MLIGGKRTSSDEQLGLSVEGFPNNSKRLRNSNPGTSRKSTPTRSPVTDNWLISWDTPSVKSNTPHVRKVRTSASVSNSEVCLLDSSGVFGPEDEPRYTEYEVEQIKRTFEEQVEQELEYLRAELEEATRAREEFEDRIIKAAEEAEVAREKILLTIEGEGNSDLEAGKALVLEIGSLERELKLRDQEAELWDQEISTQASQLRKVEGMIKKKAELRQSLELEMSGKKEKYEADLTVSIMEVDVLKESFQDTQNETTRIRKVFSQLKERYDKLKKIYESTRKNEESLANTIHKLHQDVQTSEERVLILKHHHKQLSGEADVRIAQERSKYQSDIMDYKARLQATLEEAIQMKDGFDNMISQLTLINENMDDDEDFDLSQSYIS